jgi:twitching motility protein PilU
MQTFDQALFELYEAELVTLEDALRNADSVNDLRLQIKLKSQRARNPDLAAGTEHLHIVGDPQAALNALAPRRRATDVRPPQ